MSAASTLLPAQHPDTMTATVRDEFDVAGVISMVNRFCPDHGGQVRVSLLQTDEQNG